MATKFRSFGKLSKLRLYNISTNSCFRSQFVRKFQASVSINDAQKLLMPALSPTMQEGKIVKWLKQEGDVVAAGDVLCEIETDKAVVSMETDEEGILAKILKPEETANILIGTPIALIVEEGEDWQNVTVPEDNEAVVSNSTSAGDSGQPGSQQGDGGLDELRLGPAVRHMVDMYSIDPTKVKGTGPHGILLKGDILAYIEEKGLKAASPASVPTPEITIQPSKPAAPEKQPAPAATPVKVPVVEPTPLLERDGQSYTDIPLSGMRKIIAKRLTESKTTIPHSYGTIDCQMDQLLKLRKELIADGVKVSVNDFIIKAAGVALQKVPEINAEWTKDGPRFLANVDISVAVATENGLITPIVKNVPALGLQDITNQVKDLSSRAREGKLQLHEFQGGSFTISNLGMFGITEFSAVINPPQACILAVGTSRVELDSDLHKQTLMAVTLSADARIVSEYSKAKFLEAFRDVMENPMLIIAQTAPVKLEALFAK